MKGIALPPAAELIAEPAASGIRRVALTLLDRAVAARDRLEDPADTEALHDFRVALRRLRSWIKAFDNELSDSLRKKHRRRLSDISHAAGEARDAQVHAAWLHDMEDSLGARDRLGAEWLLRRVVDKQRAADAALRTVLTDHFQATATALTEDLSVYTLRVDLREPLDAQTLGQAMASRVIALTNALGDRLAAVHTMQDQAVAHAARIAGKRLRYVLEPVATAVEGGSAFVKRLRLLQEVIGEMHDVHVVAEEVIEAAQDAGADQARRVATALLEGEAADAAVRHERSRDPRPGLLAIAAHLRARGQSAFRDLEQHWLNEHAGDLTAAGRLVAERLGRLLDDRPTPITVLNGSPRNAASQHGVTTGDAVPSSKEADALLALAIDGEEIDGARETPVTSEQNGGPAREERLQLVTEQRTPSGTDGSARDESSAAKSDPTQDNSSK